MDTYLSVDCAKSGRIVSGKGGKFSCVGRKKREFGGDESGKLLI
jgi:hypothetical protein